MKISDLYDENEEPSPFLIDTDDLRRKIGYGLGSIVIIFCVIYGFWVYKISLEVPAKQRFVCNDSICKIINSNKKNIILSTIDINRDNVDFMDVYHKTYKPKFLRRAEFGLWLSLAGANIKHKYYVSIFLKNEYVTFNIEKTKLENRVTEIRLGPVDNEKYAKEILKELNSHIHTKENIDIEIKPGWSWSYR
ncbi:MAG: hypothetical protein MJ237_08775 [bacterium]|nr:hypothetical protein [bacterium]